MKKCTQKSIGDWVGLKPNFFSDIVNERSKCPPKYALKLAPFTGISLELWIDPEPNGRLAAAWKEYMKSLHNQEQVTTDQKCQP